MDDEFIDVSRYESFGTTLKYCLYGIIAIIIAIIMFIILYKITIIIFNGAI